jgi:hypothetical protein
VGLSAAVAEDRHFITTTLIWAEQMQASDAASSILMLNDSNESALGPGVFLDTAVNLRLQPRRAPMSNVPAQRITRMSRFLDPLYYKKFGVTFYGLQDIQPNRTYYVIWSTPPGATTIDNATWEMDEGRTCGYRICTFVTKNCYVTEEEWSVGPIQDGVELFYTPLWKCYAWLFLPLTRR